MAPQSKKRKLQPASASTSKRNKSSTPQGTTPKPPKNVRTTRLVRRTVEASALAWQTVGEEFGGLEVIEGVDVVKHGDTVQFVVAAEQKPAEKEEEKKEEKKEEEEEEEEGKQEESPKKDQKKQKNKQQSKAKTTDSNQESAADSFEGFSDDAADGLDDGSDEAQEDEADLESAVPKEEKVTSKKSKANAKSKAKDKTEPETAKTQKAPPQGNSFDALVDMEDSGEDGTDMAAWMELSLSTNILSAIAKLGFAKPTAIQESTIPEIITGADVIGKAQTGSGKTLAFGIPIVEKWLDMYEGPGEMKRQGPMALILSPTRELAKQLGDHLRALCNGLPTAPYVCVVTGGLSIHKQQRQLEKADIVIGTPGRLWEVLDGDMALQSSFTKIKFLVVDEADRLFKAGQFKEAEDIIGALDRKDPEAADDEDDEDGEKLPPRQTLVFSATFDKDLQIKLAGKKRIGSGGGDDASQMEYLMKSLKFRREPLFVDANPQTQMTSGLKEGLIECGAMEKDLYLYSILALNPNRRTLVFTNSISAVRRLTPLLQNLNLAALPLHSQMIQKARLRSLERFAATRNSILVATDVAARGLDIKEVDQVLHYHVPRAADTYIHRSGRTARGDRSGVSVILCSPEEMLPTQRLAAKIHAKRNTKRQHLIETLPLDRKIVSRLKPRVTLAKQLADAVLAKEKAHSEDSWLRNAAEELGVEYDQEEFENGAPGSWGGRGGGRKQKEKDARKLSKAEMGALRAQLRDEMSRRVNLGVSERYITGGRVDVAALLREREKGTSEGLFLGGDGLIGMSV